MRPIVVVSLVVVPLVLAGCAEDVAPAAVPEEPEVILVTDANDLESLANDSFMMAAHQHDYWGGKARLTVMDHVLAGDSCCTTIGSSGFRLDFAPADGVVVPHGTSRVEVTVTWTDDHPALYEDPELWVQTAADSEMRLVGPLASGGMMVIETTDGDLDLPHQSLSAWRFGVQVAPKGGLVLTERSGGELRIFAEAVRGRDIPIYPPHPDLWGGKLALDLLQDEVPHQVWQGVVDEEGRSFSCFMGCWPRVHRAANGTVVPFDATTVEVIVDASPDPGFDFGLKYHGADTRNFTDLAPASVEGSKRTYLIPLVPGLGDSPYAAQSVWGFAMYAEKPERDGWFAGSYTLSARALRGD